MLNNINIQKIYLKKEVQAFAFALTLFLITPPYFLWNKLSPLVFVTICSILSFRNFKIDTIQKLILFLSLFTFYIFLAYKDNSSIFGILSLIGICVLVLNSDVFLNMVFKKYIYIYSITLIPSLLSYLLVNLFGVSLPYNIIDPLNEIKTYSYSQFPFFVQESHFFDIILPRFHSYYDEPGVVGTISGVLLLATKFNLKERINIPILIAGVLSFSFAFYLMLLVYIIFFVKNRFKIIGIIGLLIFLPLLSGNETINTYILSRFEIDNGQLAGDNRVMNKNFDDFFERYSKSEDFYFGLGAKSSSTYNYGGASYLDLIINYGIIPFVAFIMFFVIYAYVKIGFKKEYFIYLLIFGSIIYQRPFITNYFYMFLIFMPIIFLSENKRLKYEN